MPGAARHWKLKPIEQAGLRSRVHQRLCDGRCALWPTRILDWPPMPKSKTWCLRRDESRDFRRYIVDLRHRQTVTSRTWHRRLRGWKRWVSPQSTEDQAWPKRCGTRPADRRAARCRGPDHAAVAARRSQTSDHRAHGLRRAARPDEHLRALPPLPRTRAPMCSSSTGRARESSSGSDANWRDPYLPTCPKPARRRSIGQGIAATDIAIRVYRAARLRLTIKAVPLGSLADLKQTGDSRARV